MNKTVLIAIVALLIVGGIGFVVLQKNKSTSSLLGAKTDENVFTSIKDALSKSLSLKCEFADASGRQTTSYVKNGAVRADFTAAKAEESGSVIIKDKIMYFWNSQGGWKSDVPEEQTLPQAREDLPSGQAQGANIVDSLEANKEKCKPDVVADSLFTPPADVMFQDFSKMIQAPQGSIPAAIDKAQLEEIMKNFSPPPEN